MHSRETLGACLKHNHASFNKFVTTGYAFYHKIAIAGDFITSIKFKFFIISAFTKSAS